MTLLIALAAAAASLTVAAPAQMRSATIRTADLDLSRAADRGALGRRIASAKEAVCGSYAGAQPDEQGQIKACRAEVARQIDARRTRVAAR